MNRTSTAAILLIALVAALAGCRARRDFQFGDTVHHYEQVATRIEYPDADVVHRLGVLETPPPTTVRCAAQVEYWPLTLEEAVRTALTNSEVMRDIGGQVVSMPTTIASIYDPAIRETDPRGGVEAALSAFDATFATGLFWARNERWFNNVLLGGGTRGLSQNAADFQAEISKIAATGTQFSLRNETTFSRDNAPSILKQFPQVYETVFEGEFRHPLFQGGGIEFNRIAGPGAKPGVYNGVLVARINTDIALADFEAAVQTLLNDVERIYWELYYAYRDLDAKTAGREAALQTWRTVRRKYEAGSADPEQEARAREQFHLLDSQVINALAGTPASGQPVGLPGGVYAVERRLRRQMGLPPSDGRLIRPADDPSTVPVAFDWQESLQDSLTRRVELRRQRWVVKRRELELTAAKNFLRMRVDLLGQYRWRGAGEDLFGDRGIPHGSAFADLLDGDFQEWQLGLQLATPIGNRIGHTAVRNAELLVARERALYREQELYVSHELSNSMAELDRAYAVTRSYYNARLAAQQQLVEVGRKYDEGMVPLDFVLDAQRRTVEADSLYYRSLVDYNLAMTSVYYSRGILLGYYGVYLTEGPWTDEAYSSAAKQARRFRPKLLNYCLTRPCPVSLGVYDQQILTGSRAPDLPSSASQFDADAPPFPPDARHVPLPEPATEPVEASKGQDAETPR